MENVSNKECRVEWAHNYEFKTLLMVACVFVCVLYDMTMKLPAVTFHSFQTRLTSDCPPLRFRTGENVSDIRESRLL